jgi:hypothetical protein
VYRYSMMFYRYRSQHQIMYKNNVFLKTGTCMYHVSLALVAVETRT